MVTIVADIRQEFARKYKNQEFVIDKSGCKMLEIVGASFVADEDYIFGEVNCDYVKREIEWYESQSLNVNDIPGGPPKIWKEVATKDGFINSNYGYLIFSKENGNQYQNVLQHLSKHIDTRHGIMIYNRPSMHTDAFKNGMHDFVCCQNVQYIIRNNKLISLVIFRSNDAIFGFKNDFQWMKNVHKKLYSDLLETYTNLELGKIFWYANSFHIYERHFKLLDF